MCLNKEGGINNISYKFLVLCKFHVAYHLNELLTFCLTSGIYLNFFEFAQITLIHKKSSPHDDWDYSPVSDLSNLSKVFDNI